MRRTRVWRLITFTIDDDRGQPVPLCAFTKSDLRNARPTRTPHDAEIMIAGRTCYAVMAVLVLLAIGARIATEFFAGPASILRSPPFTLVVLLYAVIVLIPIVGPRLPKRIWGTVTDDARQSLLRATVCPSCGYSLRDVKREDDGCTICPECGAAWRLTEACQTGLAAKSAANQP